MPTIQIAAPSGFGGVIQGNFGTYQQATDGTYTVDARDVPPLLTQGFAYVKQVNRGYTFPIAPAAATSGQIVASTSLTNGTVAISHQPDVLRQVNVIVGTGTGAITGGSVSVTYIGNDGISNTDTLSAIVGASASTTQSLSRGVQTISNITIAGVVGGTTPYLRLDTTAVIALPVDPLSVDFAVNAEWDAGATIALGTVQVGMLAGIHPTTTPNGTVTYSFNYIYTSPTS